jgi:hypothetical protein
LPVPALSAPLRRRELARIRNASCVRRRAAVDELKTHTSPHSVAPRFGMRRFFNLPCITVCFALQSHFLAYPVMTRITSDGEELMINGLLVATTFRKKKQLRANASRIGRCAAIGAIDSTWLHSRMRCYGTRHAFGYEKLRNEPSNDRSGKAPASRRHVCVQVRGRTLLPDRPMSAMGAEADTGSWLIDRATAILWR